MSEKVVANSPAPLGCAVVAYLVALTYSNCAKMAETTNMAILYQLTIILISLVIRTRLGRRRAMPTHILRGVLTHSYSWR